MSSDLLLPPSTRLVHIGPHKTGTTSVQRAFHAGRDALAQFGVHYAGKNPQPVLAALAVAGGPGTKVDRQPEPKDWTRLVAEIAAAGEQRVVVSSEYFCHADQRAAQRVVDEIPGGPVHVVVTLRPLIKILPSQWQQMVQNGQWRAYPQFLEQLFGDPDGAGTQRLFWRRHTHGELVARWARAVGPENLTVVVGDESDPLMLLRTFEAMVGLPAGHFGPGEASGNRSLTGAEAETVRLIAEHFSRQKWRAPWSEAAFGQFVYNGAVRQMKAGRRPERSEAPVLTPQWAAQQAADTGALAVEKIRATGVRVIGDLDRLAARPEKADGEAGLKPPTHVPVDAVTLAVLGAISGREHPVRGDRVAASRAMLGMSTARGEPTDDGSAPTVPVEAAARAVLRTVEGHSSLTGFDDLAPVPAEAAALAVLAGRDGVNGLDVNDGNEGDGNEGGGDAEGGTSAEAGAFRPEVASAQRAADVLGLAEKSGARPQSVPAPREVPIRKRVVEQVPAGDLAKVLLSRGLGRLHRRLDR